MGSRTKQLIKRFVPGYRRSNVSVTWTRKNRDSWLWQQLKGNTFNLKPTLYGPEIEEFAQQTNTLGPQQLWEGYGHNNLAGPTRMPDKVRVPKDLGNIFTYLVQKLQPNIVVEFGTAFGVSGMYFLAGIESNRKGRLLTFEPNTAWRELAIRNMSRVSDRFKSIAGTFEDNIEGALSQGQSIDMAFIDAIHTKEFVTSQLEIVIANSNHPAIIILDDINFSDSMRECWEEVSKDSRFSCAAALRSRVGILELS